MDLNGVLSAIRNDRIIKIVVGKGCDKQEIFTVQEALLRRVSKVFAAALDNEHLGNGHKGVLEFPEDDIEAWQAFMFWTFEGKLPSIRPSPTNGEDPKQCKPSDEDSNIQELLIGYWIFGDKYDISAFQDLAMLALLKHFGQGTITKSAAWEAVKGARAESKLYLVVAREIAFLTSDLTYTWPEPDFEELMREEGFGWELVMAAKWLGHGDKYPGRPFADGATLGAGYEKDVEDYMVAEKPRRECFHPHS